MQLRPSNVPNLDPNFLALMMPGALPCAATPADANKVSLLGGDTDGDMPSFDQLLPETSSVAEERGFASPALRPEPNMTALAAFELRSLPRFVAPENGLAPTAADESAAYEETSTGDDECAPGEQPPIKNETKGATKQPEKLARNEMPAHARSLGDPAPVAAEAPLISCTIQPGQSESRSPGSGPDDDDPQESKKGRVVDSRHAILPEFASQTTRSAQFGTTRAEPPGPRAVVEFQSAGDNETAEPARAGALPDPTGWSRPAMSGANLPRAVPPLPDAHGPLQRFPSALGEELGLPLPREGNAVSPRVAIPDQDNRFPVDAVESASRLHAESFTPENADSAPVASLTPLRPIAAPARQEPPDVSEAVRREPTEPGHEANFAEPAHEFAVNFAAAERDAEKTFVDAEPQRVTPAAKKFGIGTAKAPATMPSRALSTPTSHPASEYAAVAAPAMVRENATFAAADVPVAEPQAVATAHRAVEAVLRAVDHVATRSQHSVNLRFAVGDSDLNVRVELRADEVRTTFSTDSAELRAALSHEWQALMHVNADSAFRIAPATFTSGSDQPASQAFSGDASSRGQEQQFQQQPHHHASREAQDTRGGDGFSPPSDDKRRKGWTEVRPAVVLAPAGSRHLHTLA